MSDGNDEINKKPENNDWSKVEKTQDLVYYVYAKYRNSWKKSDEISDEMLADLYNYAMLKVGKYLSMIESSKATNKDYTKLLVTHEMLEIKKLEVDFGIMLKANTAKQAKHDHLKVNKEVIQISSDGDVSSDEYVFGDEDLVLFNDVKYPLTNAEIMMFKERPTRSRAPTRQVASTSTSNAQAASTSALRRYTKIAMTRCVLGLRAPNGSNAPTLAPRKRKSKKP
ncbi:hypothetical protein Tco_1433944 [Tanacetum coccineum]